jgi:hypothetical protein
MHDDVKICALADIHNGLHFVLVYLLLQEQCAINAFDTARQKIDTSTPPDPEPWWAPDLADFSHFFARFARTIPPHKGQVFADDWVHGLRDRPRLPRELRENHQQGTLDEWRKERRRLGLSDHAKLAPPFPKQTFCTRGRVLKNHRTRHPELAHLPDEEILGWSDEVMALLDDALAEERRRLARQRREDVR